MSQLKELYFKYKLFFWPVTTGLAALVILSLVIIPQIFVYINTQGRISTANTKLEVMDAKAQELEQIDASLISKDLQTVYSVLPKEQEVPQALVTLSNLVTRSGLTLKNTVYGGSKKAEKQNNFLLTVTVIGRVNSVRDFLNNLKSSPRVFKVESIEVQFQRGTQLVEAKIPLSVYFQPGDGQAAAASDQPLPKLNSDEEKLLDDLAKQYFNTGMAVSLESTSSSVPLGRADPFE